MNMVIFMYLLIPLVMSDHNFLISTGLGSLYVAISKLVSQIYSKRVLKKLSVYLTSIKMTNVHRIILNSWTVSNSLKF